MYQVNNEVQVDENDNEAIQFNNDEDVHSSRVVTVDNGSQNED